MCKMNTVTQKLRSVSPSQGSYRPTDGLTDGPTDKETDRHCKEQQYPSGLKVRGQKSRILDIFTYMAHITSIL